ncbi:imidazolonepropionase [Desulfuromonas versatilis]|uniref:Imidazolonepropionase n=1 Tax=Desulfuromonas versatilis TaxID=2802975 RepID=A0ABM8HRT8_9BACT|nr:imidazolonepropionase [Desulfuromonas versatilis]BCR04625.1 imidazolonepropionase [Desulfuromonas versatilis]
MTSDFSRCRRIWSNVRLATLDPTVAAPYGLLENHALGIRDGIIAAIAPAGAVESAAADAQIIDGGGALLTPGLIDSHTHLVYGGHRADEFERRLQGASYQEIAKAGGGILATVRATRALSEAQLVAQARPRLLALLEEGVTTVEIKSGYGLTLADELKMLRAARQLAREFPVRIRTTLLAAHVVPPEFACNPDDWVELICSDLIPRVAGEGLAEAVDVFCEQIAFNPAQTERMFTAARDRGLGIKIHAEQLSPTGGAALAARFGAWSADHLECLDEAGVQALRQAGTVAALLPGAYYFLRETRKPPVELLRRCRVPMALATDLNPGTSPLASLRLMMNLGCVLFGLTPEEALLGVSRHAARALGLYDSLGMLAVGRSADMLLWDLDHPAQLAGQVGTPRPLQRIFAGEITHATTA